MPTFDTPEPILAVIELGAGDVRIEASDRADTVVEVTPSDPANDGDRRAAEETVVEYADGRLVVRAPRRRARSLFGPGSASIDVRVELPAGSRVDAQTATGVQTTGRLGDSRFRTANGNVDVDQTGRLDLHTANGDVSVGRSAGHADVQTANGKIRIRAIDGSAVVKTANGPITIGEVEGDLRLNTASGPISIDRAGANVEAKTATGSVRIGEVVRGSVALATGSGRLEIGVREGTAALLDAYSRHGTVRSELTAVESPAATDETVEVRARTGYGDIVVHRS